MFLYHGTTEARAKQIMHDGFKPGVSKNWHIKAKDGYVYLSLGYAPFYAANAGEGKEKLALIKVEVDELNLYPEDDYIMFALGNAKYTQDDLDQVDLEEYWEFAMSSLEHMGNAAARPEDIRIIGYRAFNPHLLGLVCDPSICPQNYLFMGEYYRGLTEWIYNGNDPLKFRQPFMVG